MVGHRDPSESCSIGLIAKMRVELADLCRTPLWGRFSFNSQRMGQVFLDASEVWRLHLQGKGGMAKREWEMWVTEPNPQLWQYKVAAISWPALATQRLRGTFFQQKNFALQ